MSVVLMEEGWVKKDNKASFKSPVVVKFPRSSLCLCTHCRTGHHQSHEQRQQRAQDEAQGALWSSQTQRTANQTAADAVSLDHFTHCG